MAHATLNPEEQCEFNSLWKKQFLAHTKCIEIEDPVNLQGETVYLLESLLNVVTLYGPECVMFVKTDKPHTVAM